MTDVSDKLDGSDGSGIPGLSFELPGFVLDACRALAAAGETAYVVGGSLRDLLRGAAPLDWDIATTATPEVVTATFRRTVPTGAKHGTVTVLIGGASLEVTTLRGEGAYTDGRRPDSVVFLSDIVEDLARRDFTVNAMAYAPHSRAFFDPFGGRRDLDRRTLRAVGDPVARFAEDALRVLRAVRFAATLEFEIEPATLAALPAAAPRLANVSAERKRDELQKLLLARSPSRGLAPMFEHGMTPFVCPPLAAFADPGGAARSRRVAARVDGVEASFPVRLAALLLDLSPEDADGCCGALKLDRRTRREVVAIASATIPDLETPCSRADVRQLLRLHGARALLDRLAVARADLAAGSLPTDGIDGLRAEADAQLAAGVPLAIGDLAIKGDDLIAELDLAPGPNVGRLLEALLDHVIAHPEDNRRDALVDRARLLAPGFDAPRTAG
jgi:tRNA nucleotidyltransferase (CCA-adding enzyme)